MPISPVAEIAPFWKFWKLNVIVFSIKISEWNDLIINRNKIIVHSLIVFLLLMFPTTKAKNYAVSNYKNKYDMKDPS